MNERFDHAMDYRQKLLRYHLDLMKGRDLVFNLQAFDFQSNDGLIQGFIRWIPKLISGNEQDQMKILDNFQPMTNVNPIPLVTERVIKENEKEIEKTSMKVISSSCLIRLII